MSVATDRRHYALLSWLEACANQGDLRPPGRAIGERFGVSPGGATGMLERLQAAGDITIERLATGRSTARPNPITPPRRARGRIGASA